VDGHFALSLKQSAIDRAVWGFPAIQKMILNPLQKPDAGQLPLRGERDKKVLSERFVSAHTLHTLCRKNRAN
jgi:hypothetical protein